MIPVLGVLTLKPVSCMLQHSWEDETSLSFPMCRVLRSPARADLVGTLGELTGKPHLSAVVP